MKIVLSILLTVSAGYLLILGFIFMSQRSLLYFPFDQRLQPRDVGLADVEEIKSITAAGHTLYSWYGRAAPGFPTLLYLHGNGGAVSSRGGIMLQLMAEGYGVFVAGYPGYGGSDGSPSEASFIEAGFVAYDTLTDLGIPAADIVIYGESLGTAVAVQLAAQRPSRAMVLTAPMYSVQDRASSIYPYLPVSLLLKDRFLSNEHIGSVHVPVLFIHGTADRIIPIDSGRRLFNEANEPKIFQAIDGAGHNNLYDYPIVPMVNRFLSQ